MSAARQAYTSRWGNLPFELDISGYSSGSAKDVIVINSALLFFLCSRYLCTKICSLKILDVNLFKSKI